MLEGLFRPTDRMSPQLRDELLSLCRHQQIDALANNPHLQRDTGLHCGCLPTDASR